MNVCGDVVYWYVSILNTNEVVLNKGRESKKCVLGMRLEI